MHYAAVLNFELLLKIQFSDTIFRPIGFGQAVLLTALISPRKKIYTKIDRLYFSVQEMMIFAVLVIQLQKKAWAVNKNTPPPPTP